MSNCTVTAWQGQAQAREMTWDRATSDMICTALDMPVAVPAALQWELTGRRLLSLQRKALCLCCTYCITILASCTSKNYVQRDDASVTKYFPMPTANLASLCDRKYCKKKIKIWEREDKALLSFISIWKRRKPSLRKKAGEIK